MTWILIRSRRRGGQAGADDGAGAGADGVGGRRRARLGAPPVPRGEEEAATHDDAGLERGAGPGGRHDLDADQRGQGHGALLVGDEPGRVGELQRGVEPDRGDAEEPGPEALADADLGVAPHQHPAGEAGRDVDHLVGGQLDGRLHHRPLAGGLRQGHLVADLEEPLAQPRRRLGGLLALEPQVLELELVGREEPHGVTGLVLLLGPTPGVAGERRHAGDLPRRLPLGSGAAERVVGKDALQLLEAGAPVPEPLDGGLQDDAEVAQGVALAGCLCRRRVVQHRRQAAVRLPRRCAGGGPGQLVGELEFPGLAGPREPGRQADLGHAPGVVHPQREVELAQPGLEEAEEGPQGRAGRREVALRDDQPVEELRVLLGDVEQVLGAGAVVEGAPYLAGHAQQARRDPAGGLAVGRWEGADVGRDVVEDHLLRHLAAPDVGPLEPARRAFPGLQAGRGSLGGQPDRRVVEDAAVDEEVLAGRALGAARPGPGAAGDHAVADGLRGEGAREGGGGEEGVHQRRERHLAVLVLDEERLLTFPGRVGVVGEPGRLAGSAPLDPDHEVLLHARQGEPLALERHHPRLEPRHREAEDHVAVGAQPGGPGRGDQPQRLVEGGPGEGRRGDALAGLGQVVEAERDPGLPEEALARVGHPRAAALQHGHEAVDRAGRGAGGQLQLGQARVGPQAFQRVVDETGLVGAQADAAGDGHRGRQRRGQGRGERDRQQGGHGGGERASDHRVFSRGAARRLGHGQ